MFPPSAKSFHPFLQEPTCVLYEATMAFDGSWIIVTKLRKSSDSAPASYAAREKLRPLGCIQDLEKLLTGGYLLGDHASCSDHGEASIVELLGLHFLELLGICGL